MSSHKICFHGGIKQYGYKDTFPNHKVDMILEGLSSKHLLKLLVGGRV